MKSFAFARRGLNKALLFQSHLLALCQNYERHQKVTLLFKLSMHNVAKEYLCGSKEEGDFQLHSDLSTIYQQVKIISQNLVFSVDEFAH